MNVKQLKQAIENLPDDMDVFVNERKTEFTYGLVNSASVEEINLVEEPGGEALCRDKALVLDEE